MILVDSSQTVLLICTITYSIFVFRKTSELKQTHDTGAQAVPSILNMQIPYGVTHSYILLSYIAGYDADSCSYYPRDCQDVQLFGGFKTSGVYHVTPIGTTDGIDVYCDMTTDGGGWLVSM